MTPLEIIKYIVERLEGTAFEPWVNVLLFSLFLVVVIVTIRLLIGQRAIERTYLISRSLFIRLNVSFRYSPEIESIRVRLSPYVDLVGYLYMTLVGFYSASIVGLFYILAPKGAVIWYGHVIAIVWIIVSFAYIRFALARASWSYHQIRSNRS